MFLALSQKLSQTPKLNANQSMIISNFINNVTATAQAAPNQMLSNNTNQFQWQRQQQQQQQNAPANAYYGNNNLTINALVNQIANNNNQYNQNFINNANGTNALAINEMNNNFNMNNMSNLSRLNANVPNQMQCRQIHGMYRHNKSFCI